MSEPPYEYALPPAASAIEALRGIGYNIRTAIADLLDNSISAGARTIWIDFEWSGAESSVNVLDDGAGMGGAELVRAMVLGSRSPLEERPATDLGRFGLGLKTASFSQCRRLIVASKTQGDDVNVRQWDLDYVKFHNEWRVLLQSTPGSLAGIERLRGLDHGTLVRWENLDHVVSGATASDEAARSRFFAAVEQLRSHLGMVFHRFLTERPALTIFVNGRRQENRVVPWDPFCESQRATQLFPEQELPGAGSVTGYVLPHRDRFASAQDFEAAAGPNGWAAQQGFYVYRGRRLLLAGGWLGLGREKAWQREEQFRLARLRLDITNATDLAWQIDVKKAVARPPATVRPLLTDLAERVRAEARRVFAFRGAYRPQQGAAPVVPIWISARDRNDRTAYKVNRDHPMVADMLARDSVPKADVRRLLALVESSVPVQRVWLDLAERPDQQSVARDALELDTVTEMATQLWRALVISRSFSAEQATSEVLRTEPFNGFPEVAETLKALRGTSS